ncbi:hypothetical protein HYDPIDRAFT_94508, partial [Hydnomerulius pinastri MD-312]
LVDQAYESIVKLLTSDWMLPERGSNGIDRQHREMSRIRQIYVPELILRLHIMLYSSRECIPGSVLFALPLTRAPDSPHLSDRNLKVALELANIVADSQYKLYDDFLHQDERRLGEYLGAVR